MMASKWSRSKVVVSVSGSSQPSLFHGIDYLNFYKTRKWCSPPDPVVVGKGKKFGGPACCSQLKNSFALGH